MLRILAALVAVIFSYGASPADAKEATKALCSTLNDHSFLLGATYEETVAALPAHDQRWSKSGLQPASDGERRRAYVAFLSTDVPVVEMRFLGHERVALYWIKRISGFPLTATDLSGAIAEVEHEAVRLTRQYGSIDRHRIDPQPAEVGKTQSLSELELRQRSGSRLSSTKHFEVIIQLIAGSRDAFLLGKSSVAVSRAFIRGCYHLLELGLFTMQGKWFAARIEELYRAPAR